MKKKMEILLILLVSLMQIVYTGNSATYSQCAKMCNADIVHTKCDTVQSEIIYPVISARTGAEEIIRHNYTPDLAYDGDTSATGNSRWCSHPRSRKWIIFDLGDQKEVDKVTLFMEKKDKSYPINIEIGNDPDSLLFVWHGSISGKGTATFPTKLGRYVKISQSNNEFLYFSIWETIIYNKANQHTIRSAWAGSSETNNLTSMAFDNDESTRWANDGLQSTAWITFDLGRPQKISEIRLLMEIGHYPYPLDIEIGNDAEKLTKAWSGVTPILPKGSVEYINIGIPGTIGRFVKVSLSSGEWLSIWEVKLLGKKNDIESKE